MPQKLAYYFLKTVMYFTDLQMLESSNSVKKTYH